MANRSYLYSVDTLPTESAAPSPIRGISEHNWRIPLAHLLLVGRDTTIVPSLIWRPRVGIAGDFAGGVQLLTRLLTAVDSDATGHGEMDEDARKIVDFLTAAPQQGRYLQLEVGELLLPETDPEDQVRTLVEHQIPEAVARAEGAIAGTEQQWLESVRSDWEDEFASFYSDVLYFSFH